MKEANGGVKTLKYPETCEECIKLGYNEFVKEEQHVGGCPYEFLNDVKRIVDGLKTKYNFEDPTLMNLIPQLEAASNNCLSSIKKKIDEMNAEIKRMERLKEMMGINEMSKSIEKLKGLIEMTVEQNHRLLKMIERRTSMEYPEMQVKDKNSEVSKEENRTQGVAKKAWRTWARNVKAENIEIQKEKIFRKYPHLTENDIKIFKNKLGNYTIMIDGNRV